MRLPCGMTAKDIDVQDAKGHRFLFAADNEGQPVFRRHCFQARSAICSRGLRSHVRVDPENPDTSGLNPHLVCARVYPPVWESAGIDPTIRVLRNAQALEAAAPSGMATVPLVLKRSVKQILLPVGCPRIERLLSKSPGLATFHL
jgi:hypothetical protein